MKKILVIFVFMFSMLGYSQENCTNGIDDDGDGLVDLNDSECICYPPALTSIIPNPSFENYSILPDSFSQLDRAIPWQQATYATSDYFHDLGYMFDGMETLTVPFPDGFGVAGGYCGTNYKEYLGANLINQMLAGNNYQLKFEIFSFENNWPSPVEDISTLSLPSLNLTIYGKSGNGNFPLPTILDPISVNQGWVILGEVVYEPSSNWEELTINFTPSFNVDTIILGPPTVLPNEYYISSFSGPYFLYDNLRLNTALSFGATINSSGNFCSNDLVLTASPNNTSLSYQWYFNGVAIAGATNPTYQVPYSLTNIGTYNVRIYNTTECSNSTGFVVSNTVATPTFTQVNPICEGTTLATLPTTSSNSVQGTWSPPLNNMQTTTYTFTPNTVECANAAQMTIVVNPKTNPSFTQVTPVCEGTTMTALPTLSNNGINGTWSPPLNNMQTTTYTFTPNTGECANAAQMTIIVNPKTNPTFTQVNPICEGTVLSALPTLSNNGINGTWSPPLNNTQTTAYTFTPNTGECANAAQMTIVVNPKTNPSFTQVNPICEGTVLSALPTLSNNGIQGTWTPALNNMQTTTYNFTPNTGECANAAQMTIVVNPKIMPLFAQIGTVCYGENFSLPTTSTNNISGTWSPVENSYETTTYAFTPNVNECAHPTSIQVQVYDDFDFVINNYCDNGNFILEVQSINSSFNVANSNYVWTVNGVSANNNNPILNITSFLNSTTVIETLPLTVGIKVTNDATNCDKTKQVTLESVYCEIQKGISPNGDTKNDFFDLRLLDVSNLSIFNRYGVKVYEKENYYDQWHGQTDNDKMLPAGVYYYLIEFKNNKESKTGWIYLILEN